MNFDNYNYLAPQSENGDDYGQEDVPDFFGIQEVGDFQLKGNNAQRQYEQSLFLGDDVTNLIQQEQTANRATAMLIGNGPQLLDKMDHLQQQQQINQTNLGDTPHPEDENYNTQKAKQYQYALLAEAQDQLLNAESDFNDIATKKLKTRAQRQAFQSLMKKDISGMYGKGFMTDEDIMDKVVQDDRLLKSLQDTGGDEFLLRQVWRDYLDAGSAYSNNFKSLFINPQALKDIANLRDQNAILAKNKDQQEGRRRDKNKQGKQQKETYLDEEDYNYYGLPSQGPQMSYQKPVTIQGGANDFLQIPISKLTKQQKDQYTVNESIPEPSQADLKPIIEKLRNENKKVRKGKTGEVVDKSEKQLMAGARRQFQAQYKKDNPTAIQLPIDKVQQLVTYFKMDPTTDKGPKFVEYGNKRESKTPKLISQLTGIQGGYVDASNQNIYDEANIGEADFVLLQNDVTQKQQDTILEQASMSNQIKVIATTETKNSKLVKDLQKMGFQVKQGFQTNYPLNKSVGGRSVKTMTVLERYPQVKNTNAVAKTQLEQFQSTMQQMRPQQQVNFEEESKGDKDEIEVLEEVYKKPSAPSQSNQGTFTSNSKSTMQMYFQEELDPQKQAEEYERLQEQSAQGLKDRLYAQRLQEEEEKQPPAQQQQQQQAMPKKAKNLEEEKIQVFPRPEYSDLKKQDKIREHWLGLVQNLKKDPKILFLDAQQLVEAFQPNGNQQLATIKQNALSTLDQLQGSVEENLARGEVHNDESLGRIINTQFATTQIEKLFAGQIVEPSDLDNKYIQLLKTYNNYVIQYANVLNEAQKGVQNNRAPLLPEQQKELINDAVDLRKQLEPMRQTLNQGLGLRLDPDVSANNLNANRETILTKDYMNEPEQPPIQNNWGFQQEIPFQSTTTTTAAPTVTPVQINNVVKDMWQMPGPQMNAQPTTFRTMADLNANIHNFQTSQNDMFETQFTGGQMPVFNVSPEQMPEVKPLDLTQLLTQVQQTSKSTSDDLLAMQATQQLNTDTSGKALEKITQVSDEVAQLKDEINIMTGTLKNLQKDASSSTGEQQKKFSSMITQNLQQQNRIIGRLGDLETKLGEGHQSWDPQQKDFANAVFQEITAVQNTIRKNGKEGKDLQDQLGSLSTKVQKSSSVLNDVQSTAGKIQTNVFNVIEGQNMMHDDLKQTLGDISKRLSENTILIQEMRNPPAPGPDSTALSQQQVADYQAGSDNVQQEVEQIVGQVLQQQSPDQAVQQQVQPSQQVAQQIYQQLPQNQIDHLQQLLQQRDINVGDVEMQDVSLDQAEILLRMSTTIEKYNLTRTQNELQRVRQQLEESKTQNKENQDHTHQQKIQELKSQDVANKLAFNKFMQYATITNSDLLHQRQHMRDKALANIKLQEVNTKEKYMEAKDKRDIKEREDTEKNRQALLTQNQTYKKDLLKLQKEVKVETRQEELKTEEAKQNRHAAEIGLKRFQFTKQMEQEQRYQQTQGKKLDQMLENQKQQNIQTNAKLDKQEKQYEALIKAQEQREQTSKEIKLEREKNETERTKLQNQILAGKQELQKEIVKQQEEYKKHKDELEQRHQEFVLRMRTEERMHMEELRNKFELQKEQARQERKIEDEEAKTKFIYKAAQANQKVEEMQKQELARRDYLRMVTERAKIIDNKMGRATNQYLKSYYDAFRVPGIEQRIFGVNFEDEEEAGGAVIAEQIYGKERFSGRLDGTDYNAHRGLTSLINQSKDDQSLRSKMNQDLLKNEADKFRKQFKESYDKVQGGMNDIDLDPATVVRDSKIVNDFTSDTLPHLHAIRKIKEDNGGKIGFDQGRMRLTDFERREILMHEQEAVDNAQKHVTATISRILSQMQQNRFVDTYYVRELNEMHESLNSWLAAGAIQQKSLQAKMNGMAQAVQNMAQQIPQYNTNLYDYIDGEVVSIAARVNQAGSEQDQREKQEQQIWAAAQKTGNQLQRQLQQMGLLQNADNYGATQGDKYSGRMGRQRYLNDRVNDMYGIRNRGQAPAALGFTDQNTQQAYQQQQQQSQGPDARQAAQAEQKFENLRGGNGKSVSGYYGPGYSVGKQLEKYANSDTKITKEDLELLQQIVLDKTTGHAMKVLPDGSVIALTDQEKDRVAICIIELCLFIYAKHVKAATENELDNLRMRIKEATGEEEEDLIPLLKVGNLLANKISSGAIGEQQIANYVKSLARIPTANDVGSSDQVMKEEEEQQQQQSNKRQRIK